MLNYVWCGMILISFFASFFTGRLDAVTAAAIEGSKAAVELCIGFLGTMCLWTGLAKVAEKSGLVEVFSKILRPVTKLLFPRLKSSSAALHAIVLNMVANLLGMGNAATPLGISAMKELDKINGKKSTASNEMCMLVVINTASIQLIPSTIISLRQLYGSVNPSEIIVPVWIVSILTVTVGVTMAKLFEKRKRL